MKVFLDAWRRNDLPAGTVATVGNFDGLHRGQRAIVERVVQAAETRQLSAAAITFEPHPLAVLRPEKAPPRLTTLDQKCELLGLAGIDAVLVITFDQEFAGTSARRFVDGLLLERLDVQELFIGSRFVFGRDREGNLALLQSLFGEGRLAHGVEEVVDGGEPISSTRIRSAIQRGDTVEAARLLGRPYCIAGTVVHGDGKGRLLGWRTINLDPENELLPLFGVYRSVVHLDEGPPRPSVTNVGLRPTVHENSMPTLESHLLDFSGDLYGQRVRVDLHERLRGERRFDTLEELKGQIRRDVAETRRRFHT